MKSIFVINENKLKYSLLQHLKMGIVFQRTKSDGIMNIVDHHMQMSRNNHQTVVELS